jgi:hypothetical protein
MVTESCSPTRPDLRTVALICLASGLLLGDSLLAQQSTAPQSTGNVSKVYIAGVGTTPYIQTVLDDVTDFLAAKKVHAKQLATSGNSTRNQLAAQAKELGGQSLLYLTLDLERGASYTLTVQCVNADGERLWNEEAPGPMIATSTASAVKSMIKKIEKKLEDRIGGKGLPLDE